MTRTLLVIAIAAAACGDDASALQGIYQAQSWTANDTSCASEGPSVLDMQFQTTFYVKEESFFGSSFLNVKFCDDLADCEMLAGEADTIHIGTYGFESGSDEDGYTSGYYSGFENMGTCEGSYLEATLTGDAQSVRIEVRETPAGGFPPDADGFCDDEAGRQAAQGQPCTRFEVITADRIADLP